MADQKQRLLTVDDKFAGDVEALAGFLDPHLAAPLKAKKAVTTAIWPWRKTLVFILAASLIGWSLVVGLVYLLAQVF
jgi:hypothetical protein